MLLTRDHFRSKDTYRLKMKGWKDILQANGNYRKAGVVILYQIKKFFLIKKVTRDKEGYYLMIKGSIQEEISVINNHTQHKSTIYDSATNSHKRRN